MPFSLRSVDDYATKLPGVTVGTRWGNRTWMIGDQGFVWERPLSKADIKRFGDRATPAGELLGVRTENLDAKDALLAMDLPGFFTIEHFNGYPAVLVELKRARASDVRTAIAAAYEAVAARATTRKPRRTTTKRKLGRGRD